MSTSGPEQDPTAPHLVGEHIGEAMGSELGKFMLSEASAMLDVPLLSSEDEDPFIAIISAIPPSDTANTQSIPQVIETDEDKKEKSDGSTPKKAAKKDKNSTEKSEAKKATVLFKEDATTHSDGKQNYTFPKRRLAGIKMGDGEHSGKVFLFIRHEIEDIKDTVKEHPTGTRLTVGGIALALTIAEVWQLGKNRRKVK
jgi:hypothetical protein